MPMTCLPLYLQILLDRINLVEFNIFLTFNVTREQFSNWLALAGHGTVTVLVGIDEI